MSRQNGMTTTVRCEALFASALQRSDGAAPAQVRQAILETLQALGHEGCAAWLAQEYGDHPDTAIARMRWARDAVAQAYDGRD